MGYLAEVSDAQSIRERFDAKVQIDPATGCHEWTAYIGSGGYGRFKIDGSMRLAHRVSYILANGPVRDDLEIDHLCRNRSCVNPAHLEPVTKRENQVRSPHSIITHMVGRTQCPQGHSNYAVRCDGARICKTCVAAQNRRRRAAKKASA